MTDPEIKELAEEFREGIKNNPPIKLNAADYAAFCDRIENPPPPSPALILAMDRARRMREARE